MCESVDMRPGPLSDSTKYREGAVCERETRRWWKREREEKRMAKGELSRTDVFGSLSACA